MVYSIVDIDKAAAEFVCRIGDRRVFAFYGGMGAGKTTFIKAVCERLGVTDAVASPTFAIVNEYEAGSMFLISDSMFPRTIYHFDFYRIKRMEEAFDIGFEDYIESGNLCLIEWPELVEPLLPDETVRVTIKEQPDGCRLVEMD